MLTYSFAGAVIRAVEGRFSPSFKAAPTQFMSAGSKRRAADALGSSEACAGGRTAGVNRKASSGRGDSVPTDPNPEETLQQAMCRLKSIKGYQDEELLKELEALSRVRDEKMTALAPLYKGDKTEAPKTAASISKAANARSSMENQRRAISDEYEAQRAKMLESLKERLKQVQSTAQKDIETLAKQGAAGSRVRRKTRARGEAGGFLAEREKAHNIASRLQEIQSKVVACCRCLFVLRRYSSRNCTCNCN